LFSVELAWITAFAGMTNPGGIFTAQIISALVFSQELAKVFIRCATRTSQSLIVSRKGAKTPSDGPTPVIPNGYEGSMKDFYRRSK